jgi:hypothetical protein
MSVSRLNKLVFLVLLIVLFHSSYAQPWKESLEEWIPKEMERSFQGIFYNIDPPGGIPGSVTAADSHYQPDYYYNWYLTANQIRKISKVMTILG